MGKVHAAGRPVLRDEQIARITPCVAENETSRLAPACCRWPVEHGACTGVAGAATQAMPHAAPHLGHPPLLGQVYVMHRERQLMRSELALDERDSLRAQHWRHGVQQATLPVRVLVQSFLTTTGRPSNVQQVNSRDTCLEEPGLLQHVLRWLEPPVAFTVKAAVIRRRA